MNLQKQSPAALLIFEISLLAIYILFISQMNMAYADSFTLQSAHSLYAIKEAKK
jgi:hypothetical protein